MKLKLLTGTLCAVLLACSAKKDGSGFDRTASGFKYKIIAAAQPGDSVRYRDVAKIQLQQYIDDSLMNTTAGKMPQYVEVNSELREFDYTELLQRMRVNDSAVCIFETADIIKRAGAAAQIPDFLKKHKQVKVFFKILASFSSDAEAMADRDKTQAALISYSGQDEKAGLAMAQRSFDSLLTTLPVKPVKLDGGVYVHIRQKGSGGRIKAGQEIAVIYKGMLTSGKVFEEAGKDNPLIIHTGTGEVVPGFEIGLSALSAGDKATLYIPASAAYGAQRAGEYIPAFSNLVYEVEIASAKDISKQQ